jgi:HSP20 family molecular chaperone IbpA
MSFDPFENLPDHIKEALRDMMKRLETLNPDDLMKMMQSVFGPDFANKVDEIFEKGQGGFNLDPETLRKFESMMTSFQSGSTGSAKTPVNFDDIDREEIAYYEIVDKSDDEGEIIVEMPGISDVRQVNWEVKGNQLFVSAKNDDISYTATIELPDGCKLQNMFATVRNAIFLIPFRR